MQVILTQSVRNLGEVDDVVKVKPGYARNYLIPKKLAVMATTSSLKALGEKQKQAAHKQEFIKEQAAEQAQKLGDVKILIQTLAGADGKLFGSVTPLMVANQLKEKGFEIDRRKISLEDIRSTGEYTATIHFHKDVKVDISIEVIKTEG